MKDCINLVTYRLNALSGDPVSQVFYLFCKELRFRSEMNSLSSQRLRVLLEPFLTKVDGL
jgi:hypothetical protein